MHLNEINCSFDISPARELLHIGFLWLLQFDPLRGICTSQHRIINSLYVILNLPQKNRFQSLCRFAQKRQKGQ
jgi:hypothetical protein